MNNELFIVKPSLKQYYGRTITKDTEFDETTSDGKVHQVLKNLVMHTTVNASQEFYGIKSTEQSELTLEMPEGTILIWDEKQGYIVPNVSFCKLRDLESDIKKVKEIYADNTDINPVE